MKKTGLLIATILFFTGTASAQKMTCDELVYYRDNTLPSAWDNARVKYQLSAELVNDIRKIKNELLDETRYSTSNFQLIPLTLKTLSDAINDIIGAASPQGQMINLAKQSGQVTIKSEKIYDAVSKGKTTLERLTGEDISLTLANEALSSLGRVGAVYSFVTNLAGNISSFQDFTDNRQALKEQLAILDQAIINYNDRLGRSLQYFEQINAYKNYVDEYLEKNCSVKKEETQTQEKPVVNSQPQTQQNMSPESLSFNGRTLGATGDCMGNIVTITSDDGSLMLIISNYNGNGNITADFYTAGCMDCLGVQLTDINSGLTYIGVSGNVSQTSQGFRISASMQELVAAATGGGASYTVNGNVSCE